MRNNDGKRYEIKKVHEIARFSSFLRNLLKKFSEITTQKKGNKIRFHISFFVLMRFVYFPTNARSSHPYISKNII